MRGRLLALVLVAGTPVIGIAGANALLAYDRDLSSSLRMVELLREAAAGRHATALAGLRGMVLGIAGADALGDVRCDGELRRLQANFPDRYTNIWALNATGRITCSALPVAGAGTYAELDYVTAARRAQSFALGAFKIGEVSGQPVIVGAAPIIEDGEIKGIIAAGLRLDAFLRRTPEGTQPHDIWLLDGQGGLLAVTQAPPDNLPAPAALERLIAAGTAAADLPSRNGVPHAFATLALDPDLRLLVGMSNAPIAEGAWIALMQRLGELAVFLAVCLAAIILGSELAISRPLRALSQRVRSWRPGEPFRPARGWSAPLEVEAVGAAFGQVVESLTKRSNELQAALAQNDLVIAEMHHRVKNNIQVIASLLTLQAARAPDVASEAALAMARDRVRALATLHRHLYARPQIEAVGISAFLAELGPQLFAAAGELRPGRIHLELDVQDMEVLADQAVSLALLVTECLMNALRHAFPHGRGGVVRVSVHLVEGIVTLAVTDDGVGREGDPTSGIGLTLIEGFAAALGGRPEWGGPPGTSLTVRFPLREATARPLER
ncbi:sensor histidine kinase [Humitalea rosea]|uniref:sensor histidine kinase n=1 Tax=Humitalea rosea TaxID=990373 RepID=UPI001FE8DAF9|nr:sensor histidine kinase [Humitalea rosea]